MIKAVVVYLGIGFAFAAAIRRLESHRDLDPTTVVLAPAFLGVALLVAIPLCILDGGTIRQSPGAK